MDKEAVSFNARFGGVPQQVYIPMAAVLAIHARENGVGTFFRQNLRMQFGWRIRHHHRKSRKSQMMRTQTTSSGWSTDITSDQIK